MTSSSKIPSQASDDTRSVDAITDQIAMQHELESLRKALSAKSKKLDAITTAFGRLEDKLEDQHHARDTLQKRYTSRKRALNAVLKKLIQLQDQQAEGHRPSTSATDLLRPPEDGLADIITDAAPKAPAARSSFLWGVTTGICVSLLLTGIGLFWWFHDLSTEKLPPPIPHSSTLAPVSEPAAAVTEAEVDSEVAVISSPKVPRTVRDRFRHGKAGPLMVVVPPGDFSMGTRGFVPGSGEHPAHRVAIQSFLISVNEVTFAEYDRFVRATGRRSPRDHGSGRGRRPVVDVSWNDALAYTQWLSRQTRRRYRLPSEAEWEYAARAGTDSAYWWGHDLESGKALCFDCGGALGNGSTAPVGSFAANPFGLNDSAGNVLEWVQDCYRPSYQDAPTDGQAREDGPCAERVARGGAFNKPSTSLRSAARHHFVPGTRINMIGFRVARDN